MQREWLSAFTARLLFFVQTMRAMIGVAAYYEFMKGTRHGWDLNAVPNLKLGER